MALTETTQFTVPDVERFKQQALRWAAQFRVAMLLDSNTACNSFNRYEWILAADAVRETLPTANFEQALRTFHKNVSQPVFGYLSYNLKNEWWKLSSRHLSKHHFADLYFFEPRYLIELRGNKAVFNRSYAESASLFDHIMRFPFTGKTAGSSALQPSVSQEQYRHTVEHIRHRIEEGDYYEMNYCVEFSSTGATCEPTFVFEKLNAFAGAPHSAFLKHDDQYLLCASPERFMMKTAQRLRSEPMKGTCRRSDDAAENETWKAQLQADEKERAENVMIVDLVRNDLSRVCKAGSVAVDELFGIRQFKTVNQMVSTVSGLLRDECDFADALHACFPMGSMTGAPKIEVMRQIDELENFNRGLFSGSVGYITPDGDFDFNVVIRSILYNSESRHLSVPVGSAITYSSVAGKEWDELLVKLKPMKLALS